MEPIAPNAPQGLVSSRYTARDKPKNPQRLAACASAQDDRERDLCRHGLHFEPPPSL